MTAWALLLPGLLIVPFAATELKAHEVRPAYLQVRQTAEEAFDILWKVPARGSLRLGIVPRLPDSCRVDMPPIERSSGDAFTSRWSVTCPNGLVGERIFLDGLADTLTDALARVELLDGTTQIARVTPAEPWFVIEASPGHAAVAWTYLGLGVEHILLGIDHLLFVLALLILVDGRRRLIATVTAFTLAHSLTLAAATLGLVRVPQPPVEAVIALSIVFVAAEIVHGRQGRPGVTASRPWLVAFIFGLLHGLGFAGALTEIGLPQQSIPFALLFFNLGVELGQLLFIAAITTLAIASRRLAIRWPVWAWRVPAYGIGAVAAYWSIERVAGFWY